MAELAPAPLDDEAHRNSRPSHTANPPPKPSWSQTLSLAVVSLGVIYGDIGTSPLYTLNGIFPSSGGLPSEEDVVGAVSVVFWAISIVPLIKYSLIALEFGTEEKEGAGGEGGPFAVFTTLYPPQTHNDEGRSITRYTTVNTDTYKTGGWFNKPATKLSLFTWVLFGTCLTISDGLLTPAVSVVSAVGGLAVAASSIETKIVPISIALLVVLFAIQPFGTKRVGVAFSPIIIVWLLLIGAGGIYNITTHPGIFRAIDPSRAVMLFVRTGDFDILSGVILCITGVEAMFANLGQFSKGSIRVGFAGFVYPAISLAYLGQGARLINDPAAILPNIFFQSIPGAVGGPFYWITFVFAIAAAFVASQAMITAVFSLVQQLTSLGAMPPVKVVHTSDEKRGQVFVPAVNFLLMVGTIALVGGFGTDAGLTNAYGFAVSGVLFVTTCTLAIAMVRVKHWPILVAVAYFVFSGFIDALFFGSALKKVPHGAYVPLALAVLLVLSFSLWHWFRAQEEVFDATHRQRLSDIIRTPATKKEEVTEEDEASSPTSPNGVDTPPSYARSVELVNGAVGVTRPPVFAFFHSPTGSTMNGAPPSFTGFVRSYMSLPAVIVFATVLVAGSAHVDEEDRYNVTKIRSVEGVYSATITFGYRDQIDLAHIATPIADRLCALEAHALRGDDPETKAALHRRISGINVSLRTVTHVIPGLHVVAKPGGSRIAGAVRKVLINTIYRRVKLLFDEYDTWEMNEENVLRIAVSAEL